MPWTERHYILAQDAGANVQVANGQAVLWDPDAGGDTFGSIGASSDGTEPITHAICNTLVNPTYVADNQPEQTPISAGQRLVNFYANAYYDGYRITAANATNDALTEGTVERWQHPGGWTEIGTGRLSVLALQDMGLQEIEEPPDEGGGSSTPDAWVQPTGAHDAYDDGDRVTHPNPDEGGALWIWESDLNANTTEPGTLPQHNYWIAIGPA